MMRAAEPARRVALYGTMDRPEVIYSNNLVRGNLPVTMSIREGGYVIDYEDEDPEIRRRFEEDLRKEGVEIAMPPVVYRQD